MFFKVTIFVKILSWNCRK